MEEGRQDMYHLWTGIVTVCDFGVSGEADLDIWHPALLFIGPLVPIV